MDQVMNIDGVDLAYEVVGDSGPSWSLTPGGRYSKDHPGVRETAQAIAERGNRVLIWDRPNCGASSLCFSGDSESAMQADHLAELLRRLDMAPAILAGGSAGSRVSMLTASRHPDVAKGLALWWISGGVFGLLGLANYYCGPSIGAAWRDGMEAVAELPIWQEPLERNPRNRGLLLSQDREEFIGIFEKWMMAYVPDPEQVVPGLSNEAAAAITVPTLVFRNSRFDPNHTTAVSEATASALPHATRAELPWPDGYIERGGTFGDQFVRWPELIPTVVDWARATFD